MNKERIFQRKILVQVDEVMRDGFCWVFRRGAARRRSGGEGGGGGWGEGGSH